MGWLNRRTAFVRNKMADVGDSLTVAYNDLSGGFSGFMTGDAVYRRMRASARTYYLRVLLDSRLTKSEFRAMHKAAKRLDFYGGPEFDTYFKDIFERYSGDPTTLQRKCSKIVRKVIAELDVFCTNYENLLLVLKDELLKSKQMLLLEDEFISNLFMRIRQEMETSRVYIPESVLNEAEVAFRRALSNQQTGEKGDVLEDVALQKANYIKRGIFARMMGTGYVIHKAKRAIKYWANRGQMNFTETLDQVIGQLDRHQLSPVTFSLLVKYAQELPRSDTLVKEITHDAKVCFSTCKKLLESVLKSMGVFLSMFKGVSDVNDVLTRLNSLRELQNKMQATLTGDRSDAMRLSDQISRLYTQLNVHFDDLRRASRRVLSEVERGDPRRLLEAA